MAAAAAASNGNSHCGSSGNGDSHFGSSGDGNSGSSGKQHCPTPCLGSMAWVDPAASQTRRALHGMHVCVGLNV
jgi:hypothetical protein